MTPTSLTIAIVLASATLARAHPAMGTPPAVAESPSGPVASITISPIHLVLPIVELTGEYRVAPHVGVAVIGGVGSVTNGTLKATAIEGGAQFNYYFMRAFAGLHAGVEAVYLHLGNVNLDNAVSGEGLAVGPYAGYKGVFSFGLTLEAQLGVDFLAVRANNSNTMATTNERRVFPLLNLNAGWSF